MVERGRARSEAEGYDIEWVEADVEDLPFEDGRFDCAGSVFGAMMAPRPRRVAEELFRVVRPGGTVGMTTWTHEGYTAELFALSRSYAPPSDQPLSDEWSDEETVRERFDGLAARFEVETRELIWEAESVEALMEMMGSASPPWVAAKQNLPPERYDEMISRATELTRERAEGDGPDHAPQRVRPDRGPQARLTARLLLEYDGTDFAGWASQPGLRSVQGTVEEALATVLRREVRLTVAGRTDRGVHARGQVASHDGEPAPARNLNALLPDDVSVLSSEAAPDGFDARRDARSRTYRYRLHTRSAREPVRAAPRALVAAPARPRRRSTPAPPRSRARTTSPPSRPPRPTTCASSATCSAPSGSRSRATCSPSGSRPTPSCATWCACWWGRCSRASRPSGFAELLDGRAAQRGGGDGAGPRALPRERRIPLNDALMRVLLTNDDGITAPGLNAMRRALLELPDVELEVIAPGLEPQRHRARGHAPRPDLGRGGGVRRRHLRLRHRRHPGGLRPLRRAGPDRVAARADRVGDQPRRQPGRRHHLLGHGRGRARGDHARHPGGRRSRSCAAADFEPLAAFVARMVEELDDVPMPEGTLLNVNCPGGEVKGACACRLGKRVYNDEMKLTEEEGGRRRYRIYGEEPSYEHEDGTDFAAIAEG